MTRFATIAAVMLTLAMATDGSVALAAQQAGHQDVDAGMLNGARISITEAIQAAEKATGGAVFNAAFTRRGDQAAYEVDLLMKDGTAVSVAIDAQTGAILKNEADMEQGESEEDASDLD